MQDASAAPPMNPATETPCDPAGLIERVLADGECPGQVATLTIGVDAAAIPAGLMSRLEVRQQLSWSEVIDDRAPRASCGPGYRLISLPEAVPEHAYDLAWVQALEHDVHPLSLLEQLARRLRSRGTLILTFAADRHPPRMPRWRDYVLAIARRLGLELQEQGPGGTWLYLRQEKEPRWRIGHARETDREEIAALFAKVFGHEMTPELWNWKYGEGRGDALIVRCSNRIIAHYGGMYRDVLNQGRHEQVAQIGDVMVAAEERGVLTRNGPFALMGATWPEVYGPKGYGFPSDRHFRIAEKIGIYDRAGEIVELTWSASAKTPNWFVVSRRHDPSDRAERRAIDRLWMIMQADFSDAVIGVRNWSYVSHRYLKHPSNHYEIMVVKRRLLGGALGVIVVRRHADYLEWLDFIGPLAFLPMAVSQVRYLASLWKLPKVVFWATDRYAAIFSRLGAARRSMEIVIPVSCWPDEGNVKNYAGRWWLTSGDSDFR